MFDFAPGTLLFADDRPDGDDNGPGQLRLSDVGNFHAGA